MWILLVNNSILVWIISNVGLLIYCIFVDVHTNEAVLEIRYTYNVGGSKGKNFTQQLCIFFCIHDFGKDVVAVDDGFSYLWFMNLNNVLFLGKLFMRILFKVISNFHLKRQVLLIRVFPKHFCLYSHFCPKISFFTVCLVSYLCEVSHGGNQRGNFWNFGHQTAGKCISNTLSDFSPVLLSDTFLES